MTPADSIRKLLERKTWWEYVYSIAGNNLRSDWLRRSDRALVRIDKAMKIHRRRMIENFGKG